MTHLSVQVVVPGALREALEGGLPRAYVPDPAPQPERKRK